MSDPERGVPEAPRTRIASLEAAAAVASERLTLVVESLPDGLALYDRDDRLVLCNKRYREIHAVSAAAIVEGARFEDILRHGLERGQYAVRRGEEAAWLARRLALFRQPDARHEQQLGCGRWLEVIELPVPDGGRVDLLVDITERKALESELADERDFLGQIMATGPAAIVAIDADGRLVFANKAAEHVLGVTAPTATSRRFDNPAWRVTAVDGGPFPADELPFARVMRTGAPVFDVRHAIERPNGTRRVLSVNAAPLAGPGGSTGKVVCSVIDITDRLQAEAALRQKETLLRGLFELCPVGIALTDYHTGAFLDVNDALLTQSGYSREELLGMTYFDITPEEYHALDRHSRELAEHGHYGPFEKENVRKDGSRFPVLLSGTMVTDHMGRSLIWSIVEDITERKAAEAQVIRQAHHDALTGLPNRHLFQERLAGALERARRGRHIGAVAMLDLDDFKTVNDSLGHKAGDAVLVEAARRLAACTRATDTVARFGGDEFLVLLDDITAPDDAARIAAKIQEALARPYVVDGEVLRLGVSIGICLFPADSADIDGLIRLADMAMYRAKRHGRNLTRFHAAADF